MKCRFLTASFFIILFIPLFHDYFYITGNKKRKTKQEKRRYVSNYKITGTNLKTKLMAYNDLQLMPMKMQIFKLLCAIKVEIIQ